MRPAPGHPDDQARWPMDPCRELVSVPKTNDECRVVACGKRSVQVSAWGRGCCLEFWHLQRLSVRRGHQLSSAQYSTVQYSTAVCKSEKRSAHVQHLKNRERIAFRTRNRANCTCACMRVQNYINVELLLYEKGKGRARGQGLHTPYG